MAFMGRGDFPSIHNKVDDLDENREIYYRTPYFYRRRRYIPLDNTYVLMQMAVTFIILIVGIIAFIATYKSTIIDPIENIKKQFINVQLIIMAIFLVITFLINYFAKNESALIKGLVVFAMVSIITMIIFCGIKLNMDATYTEEKFEEFYSEQNIEYESSEYDILKQKIDFGKNGLSVKTEKEYYISECLKLYGIFKIKTYGILGLYLLLNILLIYQILKVSKMYEKKEKVDKNDVILFDEEQNVKY